MKNPIQSLLARCDTGFYLWQKIAITAVAAVYVLSPLDVIPDVFLLIGWSDDLAIVMCLMRVWRSPTLPAPDGCGAELTNAPRRQVSVQHARVPVVRREKVGGVS